MPLVNTQSVYVLADVVYTQTHLVLHCTLVNTMDDGEVVEKKARCNMNIA